MLFKKRPFEEEVVDNSLDEILSQVVDMIEEAMDGGYHGHVRNCRPLAL